MGPLEGKTAMVTGAAQGIGRAIALKLAQQGADVALCDLNEDGLRETCEAVSGHGVRAETFTMNVAESDSVTSTVKQIEKDMDGIDVLVNNAGITRDNLVMRMSEEDWDAVLNVNLKGAFLCSRAVMRGMMKRRAGSIVNIASIIGVIGNAGQANYAASKGGVISLTKTLAKELAPRNIRVNAVAPGFIRTAMTEALPEETRQKMLEHIPLDRFGEADDVADVVLFLGSDSSAYVTGQVVSVCGGMVM
ncbi:3-oxoacyl-[acyl-carrier-protein] reductase [Kiritimatiella glycovorans]|uniref:3-oxoacyl-[acyl-carrier-protein] reductase n=1 Tax=Kiritimatiella glycovorans TaxID=1307763 RepID=A0A0G3EAM1_9BACT|nr:3-oxoacyl-[acyl-carrier-protein] reductase [Kiritimatiella glycovorans]AKJ63521.1 3-oxoacyl-[acyl-carrier-protein] reductase FabG [Kiritimatiella glycovorans]